MRKERDMKMRLRDEKEVKKWLRKLPILKKELEMKIDFYNELAGEFEKTEKHRKHVAYYNEKIDELKKEIDEHMKEVERIFNILDETERLILTARYIKMVRWDFMEFHVYYCRRQAIRIHNEAVKKIVGADVIG